MGILIDFIISKMGHSFTSTILLVPLDKGSITWTTGTVLLINKHKRMNIIIIRDSAIFTLSPDIVLKGV